VTPLPRDLPAVPTPATTVLAGTGTATEGALDLPGLARLLHLSAGVVRTTEHRARGRLLFRAAGSAGGRFPLELYVAARGVAGLEDGVHWYDPVEHALVRLAPAPRGEAATIVVTGVPWRTGWRYSERGFRHLYWDAGTMLAQLLALAESAGLPALLRTTFPDAEVTRLVGADGVHEFPLALVTLAPGEPALGSSTPAATGSIADEPLEFPLVTATQRAGDGERLGEPWPASAPLDGATPDSAPLDDVILRRGSTRLMTRGASVPRGALDWSLAAAVRGLRSDPQFVAVHAVDGLEPGMYRWPRLDRPVRAGNLRDELERVCMDQGLGSDASYVVLSMADLEAATDRDYRDAQLSAGIVEGRLHLAAYALGHGASGMTFYDSELPDLLGEPLDGMIFTCVGVPEYANRRGGRPGEPTPIGQIASRITER
jgi:SagB-type dehydrogenase family enzyme